AVAGAEAPPPGKTPISLLQEYGTRIGRTPGYDLLKAEGQAHQPNFTFRVTVGHVSCTGDSGDSGGQQGQWRQEEAAGGQQGRDMGTARGTHGVWAGGAARCWGHTEMALGAPGDPRAADNTGTPPRPAPSPQPSPRDHGRPCTPPCPHRPCLRRTQELVVQKGWRLPEYAVTQESGPAHRKEFTMTCRVERFVDMGSGTSKKLAKRNAAAKMLVRIHSVPAEPRDGTDAEPDDDSFCMAGPRLEGLRGRAPGCTWDSLRNSAGEKLAQLR
ncbi:TRBP2 protein, partial [Eudromia elegans]|nr:TRBP2 protein [Eudromia elegans]